MVKNKKYQHKGALCIIAIITLWYHLGYAQHLNMQAAKIDAEIVSTETYTTGIAGASILQIPGYFVWGGSAIKGKDGKYHLLFSLWESGPETEKFTDSWVLRSKIGYAVSDYPDREFKFKKIILEGSGYATKMPLWDAQMVHNPHIKEFNGVYYLYYIGSKDPGPQPKGSSGEHLNKRNRVQQSSTIGVLSFSNFEDLLNGDFIRPKQPILVPRTRVKKNNGLLVSPEGTIARPDNIIVVNPAVVFNPKTKKYHLYFKGNIYEPHWKGVHGLAISDHPAGPFSALDTFMFDIKMPDGTFASTEDPYVWYAKELDAFFAVVKDFSGAISGGNHALALLKSVDGLHWTTAENPLFMQREVVLKNGTILKLDRLERPQFIIDSSGFPISMCAAASIGNINSKNDGSSFNVQIPINTYITK